MERFDAACLTDAKKEYTQRLVRKLKTPFCEKIFSILKEVKEQCNDMHEDDKVLIYFQDKLEKVPEWDDVKIEQFNSYIIAQTKCDYIEELLQAVFIIHTKILAVIQHHNSTKKSELKLPSIENFIFQAFINTCRDMWKFAYLFKDSKNSCEFQQNTNICEDKIGKSIIDTIDDMLPVRDMLVEHVREYTVNDEDEDQIDKQKQKGGYAMLDEPMAFSLDNLPASTYFSPLPNETTPNMETTIPMQQLPPLSGGGSTIPPVESAPVGYTTSLTDSGATLQQNNIQPANPSTSTQMQPLTPEMTTPTPTCVQPTPAPTPALTPAPTPTPTDEIKTVEISSNTNMLNSIDGESVSLNDNPSTGPVTFDLPPNANLKGNNMNDIESLSYSQLV